MMKKITSANTPVRTLPVNWKVMAKISGPMIDDTLSLIS